MMKEFLLIERFPVSFRLLEIYNVLQELDGKALESLSEDITWVIKDSEKNLNKSALVDVVSKSYYDILELSSIDYSFVRFIEGLDYMVDFIDKVMRERMPYGDFSKLISIHLIEPSTIIYTFSVKGQEYKKWLGIS